MAGRFSCARIGWPGCHPVTRLGYPAGRNSTAARSLCGRSGELNVLIVRSPTRTAATSGEVSTKPTVSPRGGVTPTLMPAPPNSGFERVGYSDPPPLPDPTAPSLLYAIDVFQNA